MKKPTETCNTIILKNGRKKTVHLNSYAVLLCRKGDQDVKGIRCEYFQNKTDVYKAVANEWPGWNIKGIWRLCDEDFKEDEE